MTSSLPFTTRAIDCCSSARRRAAAVLLLEPVTVLLMAVCNSLALLQRCCLQTLGNRESFARRGFRLAMSRRFESSRPKLGYHLCLRVRCTLQESQLLKA